MNKDVPQAHDFTSIFAELCLVYVRCSITYHRGVTLAVRGREDSFYTGEEEEGKQSNDNLNVCRRTVRRLYVVVERSRWRQFARRDMTETDTHVRKMGASEAETEEWKVDREGGWEETKKLSIVEWMAL